MQIDSEQGVILVGVIVGEWWVGLQMEEVFEDGFEVVEEVNYLGQQRVGLGDVCNCCVEGGVRERIWFASGG